MWLQIPTAKRSFQNKSPRADCVPTLLPQREGWAHCHCRTKGDMEGTSMLETVKWVPAPSRISHKILGSLGLEGASGSSPTKAGLPRAGDTETHPGGSGMSPEMETPRPPLGACSRGSATPSRVELPVFYFITPCSVTGHHWKGSGTILCQPLELFVWIDELPS